MKKQFNSFLIAVCLLAGLPIMAQNNFPNGIFASKGTSTSGSAVFEGSTYASHFHYSTTEDTYLRGGKTTSNLYLADVGANVYIGNSGSLVNSYGLLTAYNGLNVNNGVYAVKNNNASGSAVFGGTTYASHFHYSTTEDTYIRGGKATSQVIVGDVGTNVVLGNAAGNVYSSGLFTAQNGITASKGNNTQGSAVFIGSNFATHINFSTTEDTYLRGGKATSNIYIADVNNNVIMGSVPAQPAGYRLFVDKGILTEKVKVALRTSADWADHVFNKDYPLMPLKQVEAFVQTNKHLPGVPSAETLVQQGGIDMNAMFAKQMEKIEELTLYIIQLNKKIEQLEAGKNTGTTNPIQNNN